MHRCPMPPNRHATSSPLGSGSEPRQEHITSTGWRIVGKAVNLVAPTEAAVSISSGREEDILFAAKFRARPRMGAGSVVPTVLTALDTAIARDWQDAPPLTRDRPLTRPAARFHGLRWEPIAESGAWRGELVWRHPHPVVAGAPCTTHVVLSEQPGQTTLYVRVTADGGIASVRGTVGAGQARPSFLTEINRLLRLVSDGGVAEPRPLDDAEIEDFVRDILLSETRAHPIAVVAPLEDGTFVVPPAELADELLGLAQLYVIDRHPTTFRLTDTLGDKRLSCYWGALRVYMPEFSCADHPEDHPLLVRERLLDPVIRADLVGKLGRFAAFRIRLPFAAASHPVPRPAASKAEIAATSPSPANTQPVGGAVDSTPAREASATPTAAGAELLQLFAPLPNVLSGLGGQIGALAATIAQLVDANAALRDEIERLRTTTAVRAASTTSLERRIAGLEQLLERHVSPHETGEDESLTEMRAAASAADTKDEDETESVSLRDVLRQAATAHSDGLLVLDAADRSASESPFEDVDRLAVILDAMAGIARRRQEGGLGTSLKEAFRDLGIDYRGGISAGTSERHRQQYVVQCAGGQAYDCREHIALGTSYDPRHCLRIYFTSRAPLEPRFVIGHVGRHFDVATTT